MSVFEDNLIFLKEKYPELIKVIDNLSEDNTYEMVETKTGEPNILINHKGKLLSLHSKYNAQSEAEKWISTVKEDIHKNESVLLFGAGLGYFMESVLQQTEVKQIIYCEPDIQIFNQMVRLRDIRPIFSDDRVKMVAVGDHEFVMAELAHYISTRMLGTLSVIIAPVYQRMYSESLIRLKNQIQGAVANESSNQQTHEKFNTQWIQNILFNLPYTIKYPSLAFLKDQWKGMKAIIVGSGPSLEQDIHHLNKLKGKCFIIAAGSSIQALQHFGINPDLVIAMDGGIANYRAFEKIDTNCSPILFVTQIHYKILDIYKDQMVYARFEDDPVSEYVLPNAQDVPCFHPTASVTGTALQVAAFLGADEIILMGQDLSYPNNQFYSSGVNHHTEAIIQRVLDKADEWVANVDGGRNLTTEIMVITRKNIEMNIKTLALEGVKVINTSKGGAVIEGTEWIVIEELLPQLEQLSISDFDIRDLVNNQLLSYQENEYTITFNKIRYLIKQVEDLDKKLGIITRGIQSLENNCKIRNPKQINQKLVEVNELWQWITRQDAFTVLYSFGLSHYINDYLKFVPAIVETKDTIDKAKLIVQHLGVLVEEMLDFTPELRSILIQSMERLEQFESEG
ncbi:motility associated factor glycosyltransferase family protein [Paenibacillus motobuensis]|uniref:DUF115 domain-containing protein n=1 Tax=Paenibacillus motobuensis TaxID=295324 RepID=A0ABN0XZF2_9BACL